MNAPRFIPALHFPSIRHIKHLSHSVCLKSNSSQMRMREKKQETTHSSSSPIFISWLTCALTPRETQTHAQALLCIHMSVVVPVCYCVCLLLSSSPSFFLQLLILLHCDGSAARAGGGVVYIYACRVSVLAKQARASP